MAGECMILFPKIESVHQIFGVIATEIVTPNLQN